MSRRSVRGWLLLSGLAFGLLGSTHAGFACVPQPKLVSVLPRASGPPGAKVTIDGLGFDEGRNEIRWNSREGEILATAGGPDFSVEVTVPNAEPGLYAVLVLSRLPGGAVGDTGRAAFQVTGEATPATAPGTTPSTGEAGRAPSASQSSESSLPLAASAGLVGGGLVAGVAAAALVGARRRRRSAPAT